VVQNYPRFGLDIVKLYKVSANSFINLTKHIENLYVHMLYQKRYSTPRV
jgi:hypothetical protein